MELNTYTPTGYFYTRQMSPVYSQQQAQIQKKVPQQKSLTPSPLLNMDQLIQGPQHL